MKTKILGLDLGSASVGWALIEEENGKHRILGLGSRIIPYDGTEGKDFEKGGGETRNSLRTKARTARKGYDRYQLRRKSLNSILQENGMLPDDKLVSLSKMKLWELRSRAVTGNIKKKELGRLLLWLNQKRGYKSSRSDESAGKKETEYVEAVKSRHEQIKDQRLTVGQYFYRELSRDEYFRVKDNIFPREAYIEEFDAICNKQKRYLKLSDELIRKIRDEIIYYQRPLKSQKGLVRVCEFEGFNIQKDGKEYFVGPKVAPKSSPLFQLAKMWEVVNHLKFDSKSGEEYKLSLEQKQALVHHLDSHEKLTVADLFRMLGINKKEYVVSKQLEKGLRGNVTKTAILKCLDGNEEYNKWLELKLDIVEKDEVTRCVDKKTGEIKGEKKVCCVDPSVERQPFYQLWHTIYSINNMDECSAALSSRFGFDEETARRLAKLDFGRPGFGNKSVKAIRKILPYLLEGDGYSIAMEYAGYNHSNSLTKKERSELVLLNRLKPVDKNSLRQPIVEKILNQMVNVVNSVIDEYVEPGSGKIDKIRIELARELKQSKEERNKADSAISKRQRENEEIAKSLSEYGMRATRRNILKWRLYEEMDNHEKKLNAICIYCGQPISLTEAIKGDEVDIEHIIPKVKLFDDSQSNKTLAHRRCNSTKGDQTAYDFMKSKPEELFNEYVERVNLLYSNGVIGKAKRDKLLMTESKIPDDFIDRQLRETQYIARKAYQMLQTICDDVVATTGTITSELRRLWGWEDVTMNLQFDKYKELGLTEIVEWESEHGKNKHAKERIAAWTKRNDHRHHAIDALAIACTQGSFIKRFNTLNSSKTREDMEQEISKRSIEFREKHSLLEKYIISQRPFYPSEVERAVSNILVSFKAGKRVAVKGKRKVGKRGHKRVVQEGIIIPRGALSEESVYGKIKVIDKNKPVKYLFENTGLIFKPHIKQLVEERLEQFQGDVKKALASLKKEPVYVNKAKTVMLKYASCFKEEYVLKYTVGVNFNKTDKVIDNGVREILRNRLAKFGNKPKEAFRDVQQGDESVKWYVDEGLAHPIHSVRCFTGLSAVVPVKKDEGGRDIGFVKPANNHHVAIYADAEGDKYEHVCTFWHAVERKKYGFPAVIEDVNKVWDVILSQPQDKYPDDFLEKLPKANSTLVLSMQQNEMFVLGMDHEDVRNAIKKKEYSVLSDNLYRVQKIAAGNYMFRHHLETQIIDDNNARISRRFVNVQSLNRLFAEKPYKVRLNVIGNIILDS